MLAFIVGLFRALFGFFDGLVFQLVSLVINGFFSIASMEVFNNNLVDQVINRVYVIIGIFMVFKLAMSLLQALVNPDKLTDKQNGTSKLVVRVLTVLVILVAFPTIWSFLMRAQNPIALTIPRFILGTTGAIDKNGNVNDSFNEESEDNYGQRISVATYKALLSPNDKCTSASNTQDRIDSATDMATLIDLMQEKCGSPSSEFVVDYMFLGTPLGLFIAFVMFFYCIDMAVRAIKLGLLRIVAPIPILSYIDPKAQKEGAWANWTKQLILTYTDMFLKIGIVYLVVFLLDQLLTGGVLNGFLETIVVIIGMFFFLKQAPKFILDILGIKPTGRILGIGGSMLAGAVGGLVQGGGVGGMLMGAQIGAETGINNAMNPAKPAPFAFSTTRDKLAQLSTGDNDARAGMMGRWQAAGRNAYANRLGLTESHLEQGKIYQRAAAATAAKAKANFEAYGSAIVPPSKDDFYTTQTGPNGQKVRMFNQSAYDAASAKFTADREKAYKVWQDAEKTAGKAASAYKEADTKSQKIRINSDTYTAHKKRERTMREFGSHGRVTLDHEGNEMTRTVDPGRYSPYGDSTRPAQDLTDIFNPHGGPGPGGGPPPSV